MGVVALVLAWSLAGAVGPARACSCGPGDLRRGLDRADGAFIGTFLDRDEAKPDDNGFTSSASLVEYRFRLDEAVKGQFESVVEVMSANDGATCGLEVPRGEQTGLFLRRGDNGQWQGSLCETTDPATMREVARPLPTPEGRGPPMLVAGGSFGSARTLALDNAGATLAYGAGGLEATGIAVCPGSSWMVEAAGGESGGHGVVAVRRLPEFTLHREQRVPTFESEVLTDAACPHADASTVFVWSLEWTTNIGRVRRVVEGGVREVWAGSSGEGSFSADGRTAFVVTTADTTRIAAAIDLETGRARSLAEVPTNTGRLVPNAGGTRLAAVVANDGSRPAHVLMINLTARAATVHTAELGPASSGSVVWAGDRLVYVGAWEDDPVRVFDSNLRQQAAWTGWKSPTAVVIGSTLWGLAHGGNFELQSAPFLTGPARTVQTVRGVRATDLIAVPGTSSAGPAPPAVPMAETTVPTTAAATTTTADDDAAEVLAARSTQPGSEHDAAAGLVGLATALWLVAAGGSVLVRRRWVLR